MLTKAVILNHAEKKTFVPTDRYESVETTCAFALGYHFEYDAGIDYFALELSIDFHLDFEKHYHMNPGLNEELYCLLGLIRAAPEF